MRITYVKTDHGLPKPNKPNGVNVDHVKKWGLFWTPRLIEITIQMEHNNGSLESTIVIV